MPFIADQFMEVWDVSLVAVFGDPANGNFIESSICDPNSRAWFLVCHQIRSSFFDSYLVNSAGNVFVAQNDGYDRTVWYKVAPVAEPVESNMLARRVIHAVIMRMLAIIRRWLIV